MKQTPIPDLAVEQAASTFAALGSEQRLNVLRVLVRAGDAGLTIGTLGEYENPDPSRACATGQARAADHLCRRSF